MKDPSCVVISGLSGAGKSEAAKAFEDLGYFCIDNLPAFLIPKLGELLSDSSGRINRMALVIDVRGEKFFSHLFTGLASLCESGFKCEIVFLEASDDALVKRFKESRRPHPLIADGGVIEGVAMERRMLDELRSRATVVIDTSEMNPRQLRAAIAERFSDPSRPQKLSVTVMSFGFKNGLPREADLVFDVRFLPNPHYVTDLRALNGNAPEVKQYVMRWPVTKRFLRRVFDFLSFLMPEFSKEGKSHLTIAVGCTGGKHRSVAVANAISEYVSELGYRTHCVHRDTEIPDNEDAVGMG